MSGFTKLFSEIVTSSIWCEDDKTRIVWITLLAIAGPDGVARAAIPGLANAARVSIAECEAAIDRFQQPDKFSRSQEHDGRRIERVDGGWLLLNYQKYRQTLSAQDRREYKRVKQAEYRNKKTKPEPGQDGKPASASYKKMEDRAVRAANNGNEDEFYRLAAIYTQPPPTL